MALNARQELFALEYLKDLNATQAAIRAGYSPKTAGSQAERLLKHVEIAARVQRAKEERIERVKVEADDVLRELLICVRSDIEHYALDPEKGLAYKEDAPKTSSKAIASLKIKRTQFGEDGASQEIEVKLWDKPKAIDLAMKHLGLYAAETKLKLDLGACSDEQLQRLAAGEDPVQVMMSGAPKT